MKTITNLFGVFIALLVVSSTAFAETIYVRTTGNDVTGAGTELLPYLTIQKAVDMAAANGDIIDVGPGSGFLGATNVDFNLEIRGANYGVSLADWTGNPTIITGGFGLSGNGRSITIDGVVFRDDNTNDNAPVYGTSTNASVVITNCKFEEAIPITTASWGELVINASSFDGVVNDVTGTSTGAIVANAVTTLDVRENTFNDYTGTVIELIGANETINILYNEFTANTVNGDTAKAIITLAGGSVTGDVVVTNNLFTTNENGIVISGAIAGKSISINYNKFVSNAATTYRAIRHAGTGMLAASCNAYNTADASVILGLVNGPIEAGPYNSVGTDDNGADIGFEPTAAQQCATDAPVKSSTTEGANKSYFRIQNGIDASSSGATVKVQKGTYAENLTIPRTLTVQGGYSTAWAIDTANAVTKDTEWTSVVGTVTITTGAATAKLNGLKIASTSASSSIVSTAAGTSTSINNCWIAVDPTTTIATVPTNGAVHATRAGAVYIWRTRISRPADAAPNDNQYIKALTFGSGTSCRTAHVTNSTLQGTLQFSGLSSLSIVTVSGNLIEDAGTDGISVTGNTIRTLTVTGNTITGARQNGIGFRNTANFGSTSVAVTGNVITNSGTSGTGYAGVSIASGTNCEAGPDYTGNSIYSQSSTNKNVINNRNGNIPAGCSWWGSSNDSTIVASITGGVTYASWLVGNGNSATGNGFVTSSTCTGASITASLAKVDVTCNGAANGTITTTITSGGGSAPTFAWTKQGDNSFTSTTQNQTSLSAGTYSVTITAKNTGDNPKLGATRVLSVVISEPAVIVAQVAVTNPTCYDGTGTIAVTDIGGGTGAKQIASDGNAASPTWVNVSGSSHTFTPLAGTYTVAVKDANGCIRYFNPGNNNTAGGSASAVTTTVTQPGLITAQVALTDPTCYDGTGTIAVTDIGGGTGAKQIASDGNAASPTWVNVSGSSHTFTPLAGTYTVAVKDANGCIRYFNPGNNNTAGGSASAVTTTVTQPGLITAQVALTDPTCYDGTGTIAVTDIGGGTGAKQIASDGNAASPTWVNVSGSSHTFTPLAGTYTVAVKDANGCIRYFNPGNNNTAGGSASAVTTTLTQPTAVSISSTYNGPTCAGNGTNGSIDITVTGGTGAYTYSWTKTGVTGVFSTTQDLTNLSGGTYNVTVADANNCSVAGGPYVLTQADPVAFNGTPTKTNVLCHGGSTGTITVTVTGGSGTFAYSKDGGLTYVSNQSNSSYTFTNLTAGTYNVKVRDNAEAACSTGVSEVTITQPAAVLAVTETHVDVACYGQSTGSATFTITGGTAPYSYQWDSNSGSYTNLAAGVTTYTRSSLAAGAYTLYVKDANNCETNIAVSIQQPAAALTASIASIAAVGHGSNVSFNSTISGGTGTYTKSWTTPSGSGVSSPGDVEDWTITAAQGTASGTYTLSVTDAAGCTASASVDVIVYGQTLYVATTGNDNNAGGQNTPLLTIGKALDVSQSGDAINVATGTYSESPVITGPRTITGSGNPNLGSGYFKYSIGTNDSVAISGFTSATFDNVGAENTASIQKAVHKVNSNGTVKLKGEAYNTLSTTVSLVNAVTIAGVSVSTSGTCVMNPTTSINASGTGTIMFKTYGSSTKTVRDLELKVGDATGRFFEVASGSSGAINTTRVAFKNSSSTRLYGIMNDDKSAGNVNDAARLINDGKDAGYGTGEVSYGIYAPLPASDVIIGWKSEDAGTATNSTRIGTWYPYKTTQYLTNGSVSAKRPTYNTTAAGDHFNTRPYLTFDGVDEYLTMNTTSDINSGSEKTLFVVFRTGASPSATNNVVYKHGDEDQGMSVNVTGSGAGGTWTDVQLNIYEPNGLTVANKTFTVAAAANTVYVAQIYFNGNSTTNRVGMAVDKDNGQINESVIGSGDFAPTTLTTPGTINGENMVGVGARCGAARLNNTTSGATTTTRALWFKGNVAEVVLMNTADVAKRDAVYCYLRNKYFNGNQEFENSLEKDGGAIAGEETIEFNPEIAVYPNPANDMFTVEAAILHAGDVTVTLHDAVGRTVRHVFQGSVSNNSILPVEVDVKDLPSGAYVVRISGPNDLYLATPVMVSH